MKIDAHYAMHEEKKYKEYRKHVMWFVDKKSFTLHISVFSKKSYGFGFFCRLI